MAEHPVLIQTTARADKPDEVARARQAAGLLSGELRAVFTDVEPTVWIVEGTDPIRLRAASYPPERRADVIAVLQKVARAFPHLGMVVLDG